MLALRRPDQGLSEGLRQGRRPKHKLQIGRGRLSEAEPQSDRGSDVVVLEKAEGQTAIHLREHDPGIDIPLWCKPPIDSGRDRVERSGALRVLGADAGGEPLSGVPKKEFWIWRRSHPDFLVTAYLAPTHMA